MSPTPVLWLSICLADLGVQPDEISRALPERGDQAIEDLRWLLDRLSRAEPIRINCGGLDHRPSGGGPSWSRDRFFTSGHLHGGRGNLHSERRRSTRRIDGTDDDVLYQTNRWFAASTEPLGYSIPLPPGEYRITLHFAELGDPAKGPRRFDVSAGDETVLTDYSPGAAGIATAARESFTSTVEGGALELLFHPRSRSPQICGIEVVRTR